MNNGKAEKTPIAPTFQGFLWGFFLVFVEAKNQKKKTKKNEKKKKKKPRKKSKTKKIE